MDNVYHSDYVTKANAALHRAAAEKHAQSANPSRTNVISQNYKSLSGQYLSPGQFAHNNMTPFYGSTLKQNLGENSSKTLLEAYTGVSDTYRPKREVGNESFSDQSRGVGNVFGAQNANDSYQERIVRPTAQNNTFPIPQVQVGPGIGEGFGSAPTGGYHQFEVQDSLRTQTVDDLRPVLNPDPNALGMTDRGKATFEGRTVPGKMGDARGMQSEHVKNRPDTFQERDESMLFRTTGAVVKPGIQGAFNMPNTDRASTSREVMGGAFASDRLARSAEPTVLPSRRPELDADQPGPASLTGTGLGTQYDHGKSGMLVFPNERDNTATKVQAGNVTTAVKAMFSPIVDIVKPSKKQLHVNNPRAFGHMSIQIPNKPTIYNPNDVARTTLKETLIHDGMDGGRGTVTGGKRLYVYDPEAIARTTGRETLDPAPRAANVAPTTQRARMRPQPGDVVRTTIKETMVSVERLNGNIDSMAKGGAYETTKYEARVTNKQITSDNQYFSHGENERKGQGYLTNPQEARITGKEATNVEYFGAGQTQEGKRPMSQASAQASETNAAREETLSGRAPTPSGPKQHNAGVALHEPRERLADSTARFASPLAQAPLATRGDSFTKSKFGDSEQDDGRLDPGLLSALKDNPYALRRHHTGA
jgi:hypothetical protein